MLSEETKKKIEEAAENLKFQMLGITMTTGAAIEREIAFRAFQRGAHFGHALGVEDMKEESRKPLLEQLKKIKEKFVSDERRSSFIAIDALLSEFDTVQEYEKQQIEITTLTEKLKMAEEALDYYANEKNWYSTSEGEKKIPEIRMVIASLDTEGNNWLGGRTARLTLQKIRGDNGKA